MQSRSPPPGLRTQITGDDHGLAESSIMPRFCIFLSSSLVFCQYVSVVEYGLAYVGAACPVSQSWRVAAWQVREYLLESLQFLQEFLFFSVPILQFVQEFLLLLLVRFRYFCRLRRPGTVHAIYRRKWSDSKIGVTLQGHWSPRTPYLSPPMIGEAGGYTGTPSIFCVSRFIITAEEDNQQLDRITWQEATARKLRRIQEDLHRSPVEPSLAVSLCFGVSLHDKFFHLHRLLIESVQIVVKWSFVCHGCSSWLLASLPNSKW